MSEEIYGREQERADLERFLVSVHEGPRAYVLEGEAGVGKTTLWKSAIAAARARSYTILSSQPVEPERELLFAGLGDLLEDVLDDSLPELPDPQRRALEVALLKAYPDGAPPDQRAVSLGMLAVLRALTMSCPVIIAVDDLQWLDAPSARVLQFALRRLKHEPVRVVVTLRLAGEASALPVLEKVMGDDRVDRLRLGPLPVDALDALLRSRLEVAFPRPLLLELQDASGGNPFFALEFARALARREIQPVAGQALPVPASLHQLIQDRLSSLEPGVRDLLVVAAAASSPTVQLVEAVAGPRGEDSSNLQKAVEAGIVTVEDTRLLFTHPLFRSALSAEFSPHERRALHRRLAEAVANPEERARHLALATEREDAEVASALDGAARIARARGAPDAAAQLSEQAFRLTPAEMSKDGLRRRVETAEYHLAAGDTRRARILLEEVLAASAAGPERADILRRLGKVRYRHDSCLAAANLFAQAFQDAGDDPRLKAGIERDLAWAVALWGDARAAADHARGALELAEQAGDETLLPELLAAVAFGEFATGNGFPTELLNGAVALERSSEDVPIEGRPSMILAMILKWSGDFSGARSGFSALHRRALEHGDEGSMPFLLAQMSELETWEGNLQSATRYAEEADRSALQSGQEPVRALALYSKALAASHLGEVDSARKDAEAGLDLAERAGSVPAMMLNQGVLGFIELSLDDPLAAHRYLGPLAEQLSSAGIEEPGIIRFAPDEIETLIALGELSAAESLLVPFEEGARRLQREWALLAAARCRALLTAARGDPEGALNPLEQALKAHAALPQPFELARALFVAGTIERRTRRRRAARRSLEGALETFDGLGTRLWSQRVRRKLGTSPRDATSGREAFTNAEQQVAELVASGSTNREVADRLFVSLRTVEMHLTSIYRKLGIRSRTQLAARMGEGHTRGEP